MQAFWNDCGDAVMPEEDRQVDLDEAKFIWSDVIRGVQGNYLGLIDEQDRTVQFYFDADIPDDIEDARHLEIVLLDIPQPESQGSYARSVTIGEVHRLIEIAFAHGADHRQFGELTFTAW